MKLFTVSKLHSARVQTSSPIEMPGAPGAGAIWQVLPGSDETAVPGW